MIHLVLLVLALVLFVLAGIEIKVSRVNLGWIGLACLVGSQLMGGR